jgi:hypothetical protein
MYERFKDGYRQRKVLQVVAKLQHMPRYGATARGTGLRPFARPSSSMRWISSCERSMGGRGDRDLKRDTRSQLTAWPAPSGPCVISRPAQKPMSPREGEEASVSPPSRYVVPARWSEWLPSCERLHLSARNARCNDTECPSRSVRVASKRSVSHSDGRGGGGAF